MLPLALAVISCGALRTGRVSSAAADRARITIVVPIEVVGGTPRLVDSWREAVDRAWNQADDGRPFRVCGREVRVDVRFTNRPEPRPGTRRTAARSHTVFVAHVMPGQRYTSSVWHDPGTLPTESARLGFWGSDLTPAKAAHEFGHLLGLADEYTEHDSNRNGSRDPGEGSMPDVARYPDAWTSLMAYEGGAVLERHVREVVRLHEVRDAFDCE